MLRKLVLAGATVLLLTGAAFAQFPMPGISLGGNKAAPTPEDRAKQQEIDNAYKSATQKIPDKKGPADPWGNIRPSPGSAATKKKR